MSEIVVKKHFNTAGPCNPKWHSMVPPLPRVPEAHELAMNGGYFVLHTPRQTGKTTFLRAFAQQLMDEPVVTALYFPRHLAPLRDGERTGRCSLWVGEPLQSPARTSPLRRGVRGRMNTRSGSCVPNFEAS